MKIRCLFFVIGMLFVTSAHAAILALDTIDHWQIHNGTQLVMRGNASMPHSSIHGAISKNAFKHLAIQFHHCVAYSDDFSVVVEVTDLQGNSLCVKSFHHASSVNRLIIDKKDLANWTGASVVIRYREMRPGGVNKILGKIIFV